MDIQSAWVNIYPGPEFQVREMKADCDRIAGQDRIACVRLCYRDGQFDGSATCDMIAKTIGNMVLRNVSRNYGPEISETRRCPHGKRYDDLCEKCEADDAEPLVQGPDTQL